MRLRLLHINRHMLVSSTTPILPPASTLFLLLSCCISYNYFWTMMTLIITRVKCYMSPALVLLDIFSWQLLTALNLSVKVMTSLPSRNENKPIILLLILTPTTLLLKKITYSRTFASFGLTPAFLMVFSEVPPPSACTQAQLKRNLKDVIVKSRLHQPSEHHSDTVPCLRH